MQVCLITRKWPPTVGGMETYSEKLFEGLRSRVHTRLMFLPGEPSGEAPGLWSIVGFSLRTVTALLVSSKLDVVHVTDLASWPLAWAAQFRHPKCKIVISAHGSDIAYADGPTFRHKVYGAYVRLGARVLRHSRIIANSDYIGRLTKRSGFRSVTVVPLATEFTAAVPTQRTNLLFAGRISRAKGLRFLVEEVLPNLPDSVRLRVAGPIWEESERQLLSDPKVDYLGSLSRGQLAEEYSRAKAVLIPTRQSEGFGLVAIEAAACGAWVIASDHSGLAEVVRGPIGTVVETNASERWISEARSILEKSDEELAAMSIASRREIERHYRWDRVIDATLAAYEGKQQ